MDIFIALILLLTTVSNAAASGWSYTGDTDTGNLLELKSLIKEPKGRPANWAESYPECGGEKQSPIDINTDDVEKDNLGRFTMVGFNNTNDKSMTVVNNGHSLQVTLVGNYSISGGGLKGSYLTAQFHFHWGSTLEKGSEHLIDGTAYPAEMHVVHYSDRFGSVGEAASDPTGLAVLGVLIQESTEENSNFDTLLSAIQNVQHPGNQSEIQVFNLDTILPDDLTKFYRYPGSLTTPGCNEAIVWTVFKEPIYLSSRQIALFRTLQDEAGDPIQDNFRPPQQLNGRDVVFSDPDYDGSYGSVLLPSLFVSIFSFVILAFLK